MVKLLSRSGLMGAFALHLLLGGFYTGGLRVTELAAQQVQTVMTLSSDAASLLSAPANLEVRDVTLGEALDELRSASRISLAYSPSLLPSDHRVSCDCRTVTVAEALDHLLKGTSLRFATVREQILIEPARIRIQAPQRTTSFTRIAHATPVMALPSSGEAFDRVMAGRVMAGRVMVGTVTGRVTDASSGAPLSGVQVSIVGTQLSAISGQDGRYSITGVPDGVQQVQAAIIGYAQASQEVTVSDGQTVTADFALETEAVALEGIVAVGYGTQQRRDVTGAISSVGAAELEKVNVISAAHALQGRVAGAHVTTASSAPGAAVSVRIRGSGSLASTNEPLYVVDGVPISGAEDNEPIGGRQRLGKPEPLAFLNPADIASIEVLKDASSTAIYGARGTNGVVLITTKKGYAGITRMEFESSFGLQTIPEYLPVLNGTQYAEYVNAGAEANGQELPFPDPSVYGEGPDWEELAFREALAQDHHVSVLGGTDATRFSISANYTDQQGVVKKSEFQRYSIRGSLSHRVNNWLTLGTNLNATRINSRLGMSDAAATQGPNTNVVNAVYGIPRIYPVFNEEGQHFQVVRDCPENLQVLDACSRFPSPLAIIEGTHDRSETDRVIGNVFGELDLVPGMRLRINGAANLLNSTRSEYFSRITQIGFDGNGVADAGIVERSHYLGEAILTYQRAFGGLHNVDLMLGSTIEREESFSQRMNNSSFPNDITNFYDIGAGTREGGPSINSNWSDWTLLSYLGRLNYSLADKYLFTLTGRADGSSKFGVDKKWGFFPSGAFAWRISQEPFLAGASWLSDLKLRVSYGFTGNQEIGTYRSLPQLEVLTYILGNDAVVAGYYPQRIGNPELHWEKSEQFDVGLDAAFLGGRINFAVDVYRKLTDDLLMDIPLPRETGFGSALINVGSIENKGIEASVRAQLLTGTSGPSWSTTFNISRNRNKVLDLGPIEEIYGGDIPSGNGLLVREGEPLGYFDGYRQDGIFHSQEEVDAWVNANGEPLQPGAVPGQIRYIDNNRDGVIDVNDRTVLGTAEPDFSYGWTNELEWGGFSLYTFVQGTYGNKIYNGSVDLFTGGAGRNFYAPAWLDRWTPENPDGGWPRLHILPGEGWDGPGNGLHGRWLEDGSYMRLKQVTLGYELPAEVAEHFAGMTRARIFVSADNLYTWTNYLGPNPDVNTRGQDNINRGIDLGAYPLARTYRLGINFGF